MTDNISDIVITEDIIRYRTRTPDFTSSGIPTSRGQALEWKEVTKKNIINRDSYLFPFINQTWGLSDYVAVVDRDNDLEVHIFGYSERFEARRYLATAMRARINPEK